MPKNELSSGSSQIRFRLDGLGSSTTANANNVILFSLLVIFSPERNIRAPVKIVP
jgi:hypothetical protein